MSKEFRLYLQLHEIDVGHGKLLGNTFILDSAVIIKS